MSSPTRSSPACFFGSSDEIGATVTSDGLGRVVGDGNHLKSERLADCSPSTSISNMEQNHEPEVDIPSPRAYPDSMPEYPLSAIRALTRTSCVNRLYPSSIAPGCDPQGLLSAVERNWRSLARRFALQDLQAGRVGRRLEHDWFADGVDIVIIFDLEVGPTSLKLMDCAGWDALKMRKSQALFVDSLIANAEWLCPAHLTGSRMREAAQNAKIKTKSKPVTKPTPPPELFDSFMPLCPLPRLSSKPTLRCRTSSAPVYGFTNDFPSNITSATSSREQTAPSKQAASGMRCNSSGSQSKKSTTNGSISSTDEPQSTPRPGSLQQLERQGSSTLRTSSSPASSSTFSDIQNAEDEDEDELDNLITSDPSFTGLHEVVDYSLSAQLVVERSRNESTLQPDYLLDLDLDWLGTDCGSESDIAASTGSFSGTACNDK